MEPSPQKTPTVGQRIKYAREQQRHTRGSKMSRAELARRLEERHGLKISEKTLVRKELHGHAWTDAELRGVAEETGFSYRWLKTGEEPKRSDQKRNGHSSPRFGLRNQAAEGTGKDDTESENSSELQCVGVSRFIEVLVGGVCVLRADIMLFGLESPLRIEGDIRGGSK